MRNHLLMLVICATFATASNLDQNYRHWFPKYEYHWKEVSEKCSEEVHHYWTNNRMVTNAICARAADCFLENTSETIKSNMASATIILGLTPSILALLGPSVTQVSLLSTRFPLLAILLSLASPAVNLLQLFHGAESSEDVLGTKTSALIQWWHGWFKRQHSGIKMLVRILEFVVVAIMLANTVHVSIDLDLRSVSGWRCGQMYLPLVWALLSVVVHILGIVAVRFRRPAPYSSLPSDLFQPELSTPHIMRRRTMGSFFESDSWKSTVRGEDGLIGEVLYWLASLAATVHMLFGVLVLSSLIFVGALDALPVVIRYSLSAGICQAVLLLELADMRIELMEDKAKNRAQRGKE